MISILKQLAFIATLILTPFYSSYGGNGGGSGSGASKGDGGSAAPTYSNQDDWSVFVANFTRAYNRGNVRALEAMKRVQHGFGNIDDLGGEFAKYGPGMSKWGQLINDARKNQPAAAPPPVVYRSHKNWAAFVADFTRAFERGDIEALEAMKKVQEGFANIDDLGGKFGKYGAGMSKWQQLINDAKKNKK